MTKIRDAFKDGKAFIPFLTCGDPDLETTEKLVCAMAEAGADLIELGIPFSDPTAEGPVIQEANVRALSAGTTTDKIFDMVVRIRKTVKISLVFMTYANVVFSYGSERFISKAAEIGINGPSFPSKKSASTTAAINSTREAAASPTDHFPLEASLFFANAYLYLLAINFSPNPVADCINPISKRCAQSIQYHIIHIKAANFCKQLDHFYRQTDKKAG